MLEVMSLPFMQRALVAGLLVGGLAGFYGVFVTQRGLSFMGDGLAHAAFGGAALGILLGVAPLWVAAAWAMVTALAIVWVQHQGRLRGDAAIGIFFAVSMSLGVVFLSKTESFTGDAFNYLFGSILFVTWSDVAVGAVLLAVSLLLLPLWGRWAYATFDRELAQADRLNVNRLDYVLALCVAATVVVSVKIAGIVLVSAFLIIPPATARFLARSFSGMTLWSVGLGMASAALGLWFSYAQDLPTGPAMVLVQAAAFVCALTFSQFRKP